MKIKTKEFVTGEGNETFCNFNGKNLLIHSGIYIELVRNGNVILMIRKFVLVTLESLSVPT